MNNHTFALVFAFLSLLAGYFAGRIDERGYFFKR
jgi:hypothetical protein